MVKDRKKHKASDDDDENHNESNNHEENNNDSDADDNQLNSGDEDPFGLGDHFYDMLGDQLKKIFQSFPGMFPPGMNFSGDFLKKMYGSLFKQMNIDPKKLQNMKPEDLQKLFMNNKMGAQGPIVFGMNMGIGPDGKPNIKSFGNVKPRGEGKSEVKAERDPLVDIYEEDNYLVIVMEVPGVEKKDIELRASLQELEVIAESKGRDIAPRRYHKVIALPKKINADVAKARYQNGILEVRLEIVGQSENRKKIDIE
ncbi:MAG: archaeal heat shock protein Hsp20 [Promethearchaeota archaeon]